MKQFKIAISVLILSVILTGCFGYRNRQEIYSKADIKYSPSYVANANSSLRIDGMYVYYRDSKKSNANDIIRFWPDGTFLEESRVQDLWGMYCIEGDSIIVNMYDLSSPYHDYRVWRRVYRIINDTTLSIRSAVYNDSLYWKTRNYEYEDVFYNFVHVDPMPKPNSPLKNCKWLRSK